MARRRFFVDRVERDRAALRGEDARHLRQVLRAEVGQRHELSDNHAAYLAEIDSVDREAISFRILEKLPAEELPVRLTLLLSLIKFDRFEWAVEKATELGVAAIVPVSAERSEKGLASGAIKRLERWRKIARESSQQSRRLRLPEVLAPVGCREALATVADHRLFLDEQRDAPPVPAVLPRPRPEHIAVLVGPEGGWTVFERELAAAAGWAPVSLGPLVLRAETAALAALAILLNARSAG
jgi:16S rRNA (uracil1498-N3)-methyltransferase